ncbi:MAG: hypothetical protein HY815_04495, partial [Candidatus Riflebacteria bacterium]|nr:hypothetical protein [Candidatus Riflebacteria bacterium]
SGTATITAGGRSYYGTLALTIGTQKNFQLALKDLKNVDLDIGGTGGFKISADGLAITKSVDRSPSVSVAASLEFPSDWPGIGGKTVSGSLSFGTDGDFELEVKTDLDLGISWLPIGLDIHRFVIKRTNGTFEADGEATIVVKRPLNVVLGQKDDNPVSLDCVIGLAKDKDGKTRLQFSAKALDRITIPFDIEVAQGEITISKLAVSSGPSIDLDLDLSLVLTKPSKFTLTLAFSLIPPSSFQFDITCDPELRIEFFIGRLFFKDLSYKQIFPGFMGVGCTATVRVGSDFFFGLGFGGQNVTYILPSSIPPFGFAFFDEISLTLGLFGFQACAGVGLPAPKMPSATFALEFVKDVVNGFKDNCWDPLTQLLKTKGASEIRGIFRGPGIGDLKFGLPEVMHKVVPNLPVGYLSEATKDEKVCILTIIDGMYYLTDAFSDDKIAEGIVWTFQFIQIVIKLFTDPKSVPELIPPDKRTGSFDLRFVDLVTLKGAYSVQPNQDILDKGNSPGLPVFKDLCTLADYFGSGANVPTIPDIISMQKQPVSTSFSFTSDYGTGFTGTVKDEWIDCRKYVQAAIDLMNASSPPERIFDPDRALSVHLRNMVGLHGGLEIRPRELDSSDGRMRTTLFGSSAPFKVEYPKGTQVYTGSVPLVGVTTLTVAGTILQLTSIVEAHGSQLVSVVKGSLVAGDQEAAYQQAVPVWEAKRAAFDRCEQVTAAYAPWRKWHQDRDAWRVPLKDRLSRWGDYYNEYSYALMNVHKGSIPPMPADDPRRVSSHSDWGDNLVALYKEQLGWYCQYEGAQGLEQLGPPTPPPSLPPAPQPPPGKEPPDPGPQPPDPGPPPSPPQGQDLGELSRKVAKDFNRDDPVLGYDAPKILGWVVAYQLDDKGGYHAFFTDYGTVKYDSPDTEFTAVMKGSILLDLRTAVHQMQQFKGAIFNWDSSPYMLGQMIWSMLFNDPNTKGGVDHLTSTGRQVGISFKGTSAAMLLILEDLAYYLTPPSQSGGQQTGALSGASDLEQFELRDTVLLAKPFTVTVKGAGGSESQTVRDLVIFDGGPDTAKAIQRCQDQAARLRQTDLSKLVASGLSMDGDPLIVNALRLELAAGAVQAVVRPRSLLFNRRSDGAQLVSVDAGNVALLDQLESCGPYGDPSPYPNVPGQFFIDSLPGTTSKSGSAPTSATTSIQLVDNLVDLFGAFQANHLTRTVTVKQPASIAGTYTDMGSGQLQGQVPSSSGGFWVLSDARTGMTAQLDGASPGMLKLARSALGGLSGKVWSAGAFKNVVFQYKKGAIQSDFLFETGQTITGGFKAQLEFKFGYSGVLDLDFAISGEIRFDGYFHFEGDSSTRVLGFETSGGKFVLDSNDGLIVSCTTDLYIAKSFVQGHISGHGMSFLGDLNAGVNGTGFFGTAAIEANWTPKTRFHGDLKLANHTLATMDVKIDPTGVLSFRWDVTLGPLSADVDFGFRFSTNPLSVSVHAGFTVGFHCWLGTVHFGFGADIDSDGNVSVEFCPPIKFHFNIIHGGFGCKFCLW